MPVLLAWRFAARGRSANPTPTGCNLPPFTDSLLILNSASATFGWMRRRTTCERHKRPPSIKLLTPTSKGETPPSPAHRPLMLASEVDLIDPASLRRSISFPSSLAVSLPPSPSFSLPLSLSLAPGTLSPTAASPSPNAKRQRPGADNAARGCNGHRLREIAAPLERQGTHTHTQTISFCIDIAAPVGVHSQVTHFVVVAPCVAVRCVRVLVVLKMVHPFGSVGMLAESDFGFQPVRFRRGLTTLWSQVHSCPSADLDSAIMWHWLQSRRCHPGHQRDEVWLWSLPSLAVLRDHLPRFVRKHADDRLNCVVTLPLP